MMKLQETPRTQQPSRPRFKDGYRGIQPQILEALNITKKAAIRTILSALALTACNEAATSVNVTAADAGISDTSRNIGEIHIERTVDAHSQEIRNPRDTRSPGDTSTDTETVVISVQDANAQDIQEVIITANDTETPDTSDTTDTTTNDVDTQDAINDTTDITNTQDNTNDTTTPIDIATDCSSTDELKINPIAINVIGQYTNSDITYMSGSINNGSTTVNNIGLFAPHATAIDTKNHRLFISDTGNNRVVGYILSNSNTLTDYTADYVLGQPNFTSNSQGTTSTTLAAPEALVYDHVNDQLIVADYGNRRVVFYDMVTIDNGEAAVKVLGQADFTSSTMATTQSGFRGPRGLAYDSTNGRLFVSDAQGNHRIMVFNTADGTTNGENAIKVLGQTDFTSSTYATSQNTLSSPYNLAYDGTNGRLFVADAGNYRIIVYNTADGITNGEDAANVLGQPNFTANTMAVTQSGMSYSYGVTCDSVNDRLFVGDTPNNRVVIYNSDSIINGKAGVDVLGQGLFTTSTAATSQTGLSAPYGITYESGNGHVYVSDSGNNRVMVFDAKTIKCKAKN